VLGVTALASYRRPALVACLSALAASLALVSCGGSSKGTEGLTAVEVGERLEEAGAPFTETIVDASEDAPTEAVVGLTSFARTAKDDLDLQIAVYDTVEHRKETSELQAATIAELTDSSDLFTDFTYFEASCDTVQVIGFPSDDDKVKAVRQKYDFAEVEGILNAEFDC
jgi:hypothetical protein